MGSLYRGELRKLWPCLLRPTTPTLDILYVWRLLDDESVARQTFLDDLRIIDRSEDGSVIGVEIRWGE